MRAERRRLLVRLCTPVTAVAIGIAYLIAGVIGDNVGFGIFGLAIMVAFAAVLLLATRRSETVAGLLDRRDERINQLDLQATAAAGFAVIVVILVGLVVEIARGHDGSPYSWLAAVAGVAYAAALVTLRIRR